MKKFLFLICIFQPFYLTAKAEEIPFLIQIKYAPWGVIYAGEDDFNYFGGNTSYQKYEMDFERSIGIRAIASPLYVAVNRSTTQIDTDIPDAIVETISGGVAGIMTSDSHTYLIGALGVGKGRFTFKDPDMNDWEAFAEANIEMGFLIEDHLTIGVGADWQLFGKPGDTKADYLNLYLGTGVSF